MTGSQEATCRPRTGPKQGADPGWRPRAQTSASAPPADPPGTSRTTGRHQPRREPRPPWHHARAAGTVVIALVMLVTAGSYGAGHDNPSDLMLFAAGLAVPPAWLTWTSRIDGTGDAPPDPR